jgi:hypothetical protein
MCAFTSEISASRHCAAMQNLVAIGHDGAWSSRSKQARFVSTRPSSHHAVRLVRFGMPPTAMISALSCSMVVRWRMAVCRISAKASSSESA